MGRFVWYSLFFSFFVIATSWGIMAAFAFTGICAALAIIAFVAVLYGQHDERLKAQRRSEEEEPREPFCENWGRRLAEWRHANKGSSQ